MSGPPGGAKLSDEPSAPVKVVDTAVVHPEKSTAEMAGQIWDFLSSFRGTEFYAKYKDEIEKKPAYIDSGSIALFAGGWGHEKPSFSNYGQDPACYSLLTILRPGHPRGKVLYKFGYKWMGYSAEKTYLHSAQDLARLEKEYIVDLCKFIVDGNGVRLRDSLAKGGPGDRNATLTLADGRIQRMGVQEHD